MNELTIKDMQTWLKTKATDTFFINGAVDRNNPQCVGLYNTKNGTPQPIAYGGSSYGIKPVTMLVHWTDNANTCEEKAIELADTLKTAGTEEVMGGFKCFIIDVVGPVDVGVDAGGIYERVVNFKIYYRK